MSFKNSGPHPLPALIVVALAVLAAIGGLHDNTPVRFFSLGTYPAYDYARAGLLLAALYLIWMVKYQL